MQWIDLLYDSKAVSESLQHTMLHCLVTCANDPKVLAAWMDALDCREHYMSGGVQGPGNTSLVVCSGQAHVEHV